MKEISKLYLYIGSKISKARSDKEMTQDDLAKHIGIGRTSIVNIEKGNQKLPIETLYKIAQILEVSVYELLPDVNFDKIQLYNISMDNLNQKSQKDILETLNLTNLKKYKKET